jgi:putative cofactor-binding repeat protein
MNSIPLLSNVAVNNSEGIGRILRAIHVSVTGNLAD